MNVGNRYSDYQKSFEKGGGRSVSATSPNGLESPFSFRKRAHEPDITFGRCFIPEGTELDLSVQFVSLFREDPLFTRNMRRLLLLLCVALLLAAASHAAPPNVVLIISDDHGWSDYGFMGHEKVRTPHLDRLASQGLVFPRGYVPASLCCPSLASIVTGKYPHQHRIVSNDPPLPAGLKGAAMRKSPEFLQGRARMSSFMREASTLPRWLGALGYVSFQTGKWWQGHFSTGGFTHGMSLGEEDKGGRHGDAGLEIGRKTMQPMFDFIANAAAEKKPFLVWYAPMLPHDPHNAPERILAKYRDRAPNEATARYWANIEWFDETCGQLLDFLNAQKVAENTLVLYVADNGWIPGAQMNRFDPRSKQSPYDGGLRTPILVRWPGKVKAERSPQLASSLDLAPTVLAAVGAKVPADLPGVNLLDGTAVSQRKTLFGECFTHNAVDLDRPASGLRWRWVIDGEWKLIVPAERNEPDGKIELFNIEADPTESRNLAETEPDRVKRLRGLLDGWWRGE
jgi:arylsulfatase A-like enzyme